MTGCQSCDEFLIEYLLALEEVRIARQQLAYATNLDEWEAARVRLARVEAYKEHATREVTAHCNDTGCVMPDLRKPVLDLIVQ
jgi:tartrate dehydratase alpha subunit/fumarate hydratase class I-like protein